MLDRYFDDFRYERISPVDYDALQNAATSHLPKTEARPSGVFDGMDVGWDQSRAAFSQESTQAQFEAQRASPRRLDGVVGNVGETFQQMLFRLIREKGKEYLDIRRLANIDKGVGSRINSNEHYSPSKDTVLSFSIALELSLDETTDFLMKAGYALSHSKTRDLIIKYFISERVHDIFLINETLFLYNQRLLGERSMT